MTPFRVSARELQVIELVALGLTSRGIGVLLCLSPRTVERHVRRACARCGVQTRLTLVVRAIEAGWVSA